MAFRSRGTSGLAVVGGMSADDVPVVGFVHDPVGSVGRAERTVKGRVHDMHPVGIHRGRLRAWFAAGNALGDRVLRRVGGDRADLSISTRGVIAWGMELLAAPLIATCS